MKLKHRLAHKYLQSLNKAHDITNPESDPKVISDAWLAGFDRFKAHMIDYAKRFLDNPNLKPGQHHEELIRQIGEQSFESYKKS